eukprot:TRINITY_DN102627_c0_g1_i1.p1 TRINITY_DN102627_c0_g1~~TRINITY_DN102627_c0_g1_i1.p1  ORF type:complete len:633 (+),score=200.15 TRINITY_DN102627_c0_g1_i1:101-1999(+)
MASEDGDLKTSVKEVFRKFDSNGDGIISREELAAVFKLLSKDGGKQGPFTDPRVVDNLMAAADTNKDGRICYEEFVEWLMKERSKPTIVHEVALDYRSLLPERFEADVSKRYNLDKLAIGEGGYGKVYVAKDSKFQNRLVAVKKVTRTEPATTANLQEDKINVDLELRLMKELDHPGICKLLEIFQQGKDMFYVMEFCEGGELFDKIIEMKRVGEALTADVTGQVASALHYAHTRCICHRDVKPENVVFCTKDPKDTRVKLIDWGLGIDWADCAMKAAVGSLTYAAPEVITSRHSKAYTAACDVWSLGVLTYVTMLGKPPFWGSQRNHIQKAMAGEFPRDGPGSGVAALWQSFTPEAQEFIQTLLTGNPDNRPAMDVVVMHPFLTKARPSATDTSAASAVLQNMKQFSGTSTFGAVCVAAVARQLDHSKLKGVHAVFRELDTNGDGVLSFEEISDGFGKFYGNSSKEYKQVMKTFRSLDLDGSAFVDYTEFCAASLGQQAISQDESLWAAFKSFDLDNSDKLSKEELLQVLDKVDMQEAWSHEVCKSAADEVLSKFDKDGDGQVDFNEWQAMMRACWEKHNARAAADPTADAAAANTNDSMVEEGSFQKLRRNYFSAYDFLQQVSDLKTTAA